MTSTSFNLVVGLVWCAFGAIAALVVLAWRERSIMLALKPRAFRQGVLFRAEPYACALDPKRLRPGRGSTPNARFRVVARKEILFVHRPSWVWHLWATVHPALKGRLVHDGSGWKLEARLAGVWLAAMGFMAVLFLVVSTLFQFRGNEVGFRSFLWLVPYALVVSYWHWFTRWLARYLADDICRELSRRALAVEG